MLMLSLAPVGLAHNLHAGHTVTISWRGGRRIPDNVNTEFTNVANRSNFLLIVSYKVHNIFLVNFALRSSCWPAVFCMFLMIMLGKNKYCSWKMNSLRLYRISGNLHGIILPQFQIPNWASIGFMRERGKGGCGQWKPLQSGRPLFQKRVETHRWWGRRWTPLFPERRGNSEWSASQLACEHNGRRIWQRPSKFQSQPFLLQPPDQTSTGHWTI